MRKVFLIRILLITVLVFILVLLVSINSKLNDLLVLNKKVSLLNDKIDTIASEVIPLGETNGFYRVPQGDTNSLDEVTKE